MGQIKLTGLKSGMPMGFMAALGALRQASHVPELGKVELAWTPYTGEWCALLLTANAVERDAFVKLLLGRVKAIGERREFAWAAAVKNSSRDDFVTAASRSLLEASADDRELADWFAAFGTELAIKNDAIDSTPLDMTVARQRFLADAASLTRSLATPDKKAGDAPNTSSVKEALFGPWKYRDNQHSLGWDPSTLLMGAFTPTAPTAMNKAGVRAAVWLAMESLPFFPCVYEHGLATRAFVRTGRKLSLHWPIWTEPLSVVAIRTLLSQTPKMVEDGEWRARGIAAVYASTIYKPNKYLSSFQPAILLG